MSAANLVGRPIATDWMGSQPDSAPTNGGCSVRRFPAGSLISVDTTNLGDFCDFAGDWSLDHQPIGGKQLHLSVRGFRTPVFELALLEQAGDCCWQGVTPTGTVSLGVPQDGSEPISHCGRSLGKLQMALTRSGEDFEVVAPSGARHLVASFAQARVEKYAADVWREPHLLKPPTGRLRFPDEARRRRYVGTCEAILGDIGKRPKLLIDARSASALEETLLESLFVEGCADELVNDRNRYQVARRSYRHLLEATEDVPTIRELCAITGASYSTLERGYRETYGMAPQAHIKAMRLSRVRKDLLRPADDASVTSVAVRWGFFELGRFSVQYRQRFGESPSETLRQARARSSVTAAQAEEPTDSY